MKKQLTIKKKTVIKLNNTTVKNSKMIKDYKDDNGGTVGTSGEEVSSLSIIHTFTTLF